uniref:Uncharacterized protein n=1 Tax=Melopsittacus undulatus TaxID=13146 RepID=A0A8C6JDI9_MELUD
MCFWGLSQVSLWKPAIFFSSRIHESLSYLEGRATVFHSSYLSAWANTSAGEKTSVALGHFVLPPACLQEEIRRQIGCFIWEQADDSLGSPACPVLTAVELLRVQVTPLPSCFLGEGAALRVLPLQQYLLQGVPFAGYASARDMRKYVGELHDFIPGTSGYEAYWVKQKINIFGDVKTRMKRKL